MLFFADRTAVEYRTITPMDAPTILLSLLLSLLPISEVRGAIPFALARGIELVPAYLLGVSANALVGPLVFLFLSTLHRFFSRLRFYTKVYEKVVEKSRQRVHRKIEKYGYAGLVLFVAIPLPITGAYTGAIGAWVLGMDSRRSFAAIAAGVAIAGVVVSAVSVIGIKALSFLIHD